MPRHWVVDLAAQEVVVHEQPRGAGDDARWEQVRRLPFDAELEVLGVRLRLADVLAG